MSHDAPGAAGQKSDPSVRKQVRGSTLLLSGRGLSILLNLITQIVIVRALTRADYGLLAYAISSVETLSLVAAFCMDKTFLRYGAIYQQQNDRGRLTGAILLAAGVTLTLGGAIATALLASSWLVDWSWQTTPEGKSLLLIFAALVPINAFSSVTISVLTVLRGARAVFTRKHLFGPALRLCVVVGVALMGGGPTTFALAMTAAGICGLLFDLWLLHRILLEEDLRPFRRETPTRFPFRDIFSYSLPSLGSDFAFLTRGTLIVVLLGWLCTDTETASFRAVLPIVRLNEVVMIAFSSLFTPIASRLFASQSFTSLWSTYRQTALWIMVLSFPIFAGCVALARPLTVLMYGPSYADASRLLTILATAYFVQASYGFNGRLLRVLGHVRLILWIDIASALCTITLCALTIPYWGAMGAAGATAAGIVAHCLMKSIIVRRLAPEAGGDRAAQSLTRTVNLIAMGTVVTAVLETPGWWDGILLTATSSLLVLFLCRESLEIGTAFPELSRWFGSLWLWGDRTMQCAHELRANGHTSPRIAYIMSRFPKLTETFVLREMIAMEQQGVDVRVYPLQREQTSVCHAEAERFVAQACFTPWLSPAIVRDNLRRLIRQPYLYLSTLLHALWANRSCLRYLFGVIAFFPKTVHLARQMEADGITHIHAHFASHPAFAAWLVHKLTGIPYSFTAHGSDLHRTQCMLREKVTDAAATITISEYNRSLILETCGNAFAKKVHVVHCGIDRTLFPKRTEPTPFERNDGPFQIVCIGTLHEVKGQRYLIEACARLGEAKVDFNCHFVGDGPDRAALESLVETWQLGNQVEFHGRRTSDQIRDLLQEMDVIVAPSVPTSDGRREGIPVVLMEGMGRGLVAVASELSGIPELVRHGITGLTTRPRSSEDIAEALLMLHADAATRHMFADAGADLVSDEFDVQKNTHQLFEILVGRAAGVPRASEPLAMDSPEPVLQEDLR